MSVRVGLLYRQGKIRSRKSSMAFVNGSESKKITKKGVRTQETSFSAVSRLGCKLDRTSSSGNAETADVGLTLLGVKPRSRAWPL